jgi:hypothetical protein
MLSQSQECHSSCGAAGSTPEVVQIFRSLPHAVLDQVCGAIRVGVTTKNANERERGDDLGSHSTGPS